MNSRDITVILIVVLGVILFVPALTMSIWGFGMMGPGMMGRGMIPGGYGLFAVVLLLLAGVLLTVAMSRRARVSDPLEVLKQRLARGEVTKEQYEDLKHLLQS